MSSVDEIKSKLDIVEVIGGYLTLTRAGSNYKARCPFHNERTPSFSVSADRQMYYCFGCGDGGDMVDFIQRMEGVDFLGAMKILADQAGVVFEGERHEGRDEKRQLYEITEAACLFYQSRIPDYPETAAYLVGRGVSEASRAVWRLGYAPDGWRNLSDYLVKKGWSEDDLIRAGLAKQAKGGRIYDVFRDRIIFPINDAAGHVVGFSGRAFHESNPSTSSGQAPPPKYLNSPDTPIFHKSTILYGLDRAKQAIRTMNFSVLVEGQMDLLLSHQRGFQNTVATSGTAVTREHLKRLSRLSTNLMLAFDADTAGVGATQKSAAIALSLGMDVKVAQTPAGKDPADILTEKPEKWKRILSEAKPVVMFLFDWVMETTEDDQRKQTKRVASEVLPYIAALDQQSEQSHYIGSIAGKLGVREDALWADLEKTRPATADIPQEQTADSSVNDDISAETSEKSRKDMIARHIAALISWQKAKEEADLDVAKLHSQFAEIYGDSEATALLETIEGDSKTAFDIEEYYTQEPPGEEGLAELFHQLTIETLIQERGVIKQKLEEAERHGETADIRTYMKELQLLQSRIDQMKREGHNRET